ncbi:hypothetical protein [Halobacillus salinus]|uniref:Uncharacterized protein n=1 Tax=Halobacillus salinus TaxID=192814 RepID=A0A4Z0GZI4_9BACI|nr:hypothetical protein [Halobacillus salinus]TGB03613.1 hypothetical protein E4663_00985 [Halobacillus salinus]
MKREEKSFLIKWTIRKEKGKQSYMIKRSLTFTVLYLAAFLLLFDHYLEAGTPIGEWLVTGTWYLIMAFFLGSFTANLRWKLNEKRYHQMSGGS